MSKHPLAVVCALAFAAGGAAAVALHQQPRDTAAAHAVAAESDDAGREARAETDSSTVEAAETAPAEEAPATDAGGEAEDSVEVVDREAGDRVEAGTGAASARAHRRAVGVRDASDAPPRPARRYATVSRGGGGGGGVGGVGRGVAGHTVRGVKKTGAAIGKTFGKIGGVFHD